MTDFSPSITAVPQSPGQGSEGQAENLWSDILGCLLVLSTGWLGSKAGFPGLAVWGVCPGSESQSALTNLIFQQACLNPSEQWETTHPYNSSLHSSVCVGGRGTRYNLMSFTEKEGLDLCPFLVLIQVLTRPLPDQHLILNSLQSTVSRFQRGAFVNVCTVVVQFFSTIHQLYIRMTSL